MKKKEYEKPDITVILCEDDVILTSSFGGGYEDDITDDSFWD